MVNLKSKMTLSLTNSNFLVKNLHEANNPNPGVHLGVPCPYPDLGVREVHIRRGVELELRILVEVADKRLEVVGTLELVDNQVVE